MVGTFFACFQKHSCSMITTPTPGPKCRNLKVKNPEKYSWDPKWLLSHLIDIYLHLDSPKLIQAVANDQRAFKLTTFQDTARRMEATLGR